MSMKRLLLVLSLLTTSLELYSQVLAPLPPTSAERYQSLETFANSARSLSPSESGPV